MEIINTKKAMKDLSAARPTVNADNKVTKWDIEVQYTLEDYSSTYMVQKDIENPSKTPDQYTRAEIFGFVNKDHLDMVFESQYTSVKLASDQPSERKVSDFDISSLKK